MSKAFRWRVLLVVAVLGGAVALVVTRPVVLGLDLRGGTQIVLEAQDTPEQKVDGDTASRTLEVLRRRVDALGVSEPNLQRSGDRRIIVELPGVADPEQALSVIGRNAQLAFHLVLGLADGSTSTAVVPGGDPQELVLSDADGFRLRLGPPRVTGAGVGTARATLGGSFGGQWQVQVDFRSDGSREWTALTGEAACAPVGDPTRRIAIVLDDKVVSSPGVSPEVQCGAGISGGDTVITGQFTQREAQDLALLIRAGALPVPVTVVEQRTIGPTLGDAAISASVKATIIDASLTILYMLVYYRLLGALAALALGAYGLISFVQGPKTRRRLDCGGPQATRPTSPPKAQGEEGRSATMSSGASEPSAHDKALVLGDAERPQRAREMLQGVGADG